VGADDQNSRSGTDRGIDPDLLARFAQVLRPRETPSHGGVDPAVPEVRRFGSVSASRNRTGQPANRVHGLQDNEIGFLPALLDWYAEDDAEPVFLISRLLPTDRAQDRLRDAGFGPNGTTWAVLAGRAVAGNPEPLPGTTVRRFEPTEAALYARLVADAHQWPRAWRRPAIQALARTFPGRAEHFLALVAGTPAGVGSMRLDGDIAVLSGGGVLPAFRGRGIHGALLAFRMAAAFQAGATWVLGRALAGSASERNLVRMGLGRVWTEDEWTRAGSG
jgi:hypothetical protein